MSVKRLLLTREEAAEMCACSLSHFKRHIQPHVPCVYVGRLRMYRPGDLERHIAERVTNRQAAA